MKQKNIRVGVFGTYVPHYRLGIYKALQTLKDVTFTICAPQNNPNSYLEITTKEDFPYHNTLTLQLDDLIQQSQHSSITAISH